MERKQKNEKGLSVMQNHLSDAQKPLASMDLFDLK